MKHESSNNAAAASTARWTALTPRVSMLKRDLQLLHSSVRGEFERFFLEMRRDCSVILRNVDSVMHQQRAEKQADAPGAAGTLTRAARMCARHLACRTRTLATAVTTLCVPSHRNDALMRKSHGVSYDDPPPRPAPKLPKKKKKKKKRLAAAR